MCSNSCVAGMLELLGGGVGIFDMDMVSRNSWPAVCVLWSYRQDAIHTIVLSSTLGCNYTQNPPQFKD